jgi:hypothetical protein
MSFGQRDTRRSRQRPGYGPSSAIRRASPQVAVTTNTRLGHAAGNRNRDACMSVVRKFVAVGAVLGLALGILVSVTTDVPFAPEAGLLLGALVGWFSHALRDPPVPD